MPQSVFHFKQFSIYQDRCAMKVGTDGVLLGSWVDPGLAERMLDIGTGTGLLALMLAQRSDAQIDGIDIDEASCLQASENVHASPWKERIRIICKPLQEYNPVGKYDLIVSNPPYFLNSYAPQNEARKRARQASGTLTYEDLLTNSLRLLNVTGRLCVILPFNESVIFREQAMQQGLFPCKITSVFSREGKPAKRVLMEFSRKECERQESELVLHGHGRAYSEEYRELTSAYFPEIRKEEDAAPQK